MLGTENGMYETNDSYCQAIEEAGGLPVQFGFDKVYDKLSVLKPDAVLLPGGAFRTPDCWYGKFEGDDSVNDRTKAYQEMIRYAQEFRLPLLGICAGIQLLAVSFSSLLIQKVDGHSCSGIDEAHSIRIQAGSLLADIVGPKELVVNSRHNEAVNPNILGDELRITAMSEDGVVEAIEMVEPWCEFVLGVQFHPENLAIREMPDARKFSNDLSRLRPGMPENKKIFQKTRQRPERSAVFLRFQIIYG